MARAGPEGGDATWWRSLVVVRVAAALAVGAGLVVGVVGAASAATPGQGGRAVRRPAAAAWSVVERAVRPAVVAALGRRAAGRVLGRRAVRRALSEAFAGFRPGRDRVDVRLVGAADGADQEAPRQDGQRGGEAPAGQVLVVRVYVGGLGRCVRLDPGSPERGASECAHAAPVHPRTVRVDQDVWDEHRRRPRSTRRPKTTAQTKQQAKPQPQTEATPPSVLRLPARERARPPSPGQRLLGRLAALRQTARARHWTDPFAPRREIGDALPDVRLPRRRRVSAWPQWTSIEGNALENLRYYFGQGRMRPAWPVPDFFGDRVRRPPSAQGAATVARPDGDCLAAWAARERHPDPPKLACFRQALRYRRLSRDTVYQAASVLSRFLAVPLLGQLMVMRVGETKRETVSSTLWLHTWMGWARLHPGRLGAAAKGLAAEECVRLREHLWRWWGRRAYAAYEETISRLYERHFGALYPEALGGDGLPRRGRFPEPALWALNWLHAVERLDPARRRASVPGLLTRPADVLLVGNLSAERGVASQVPHAARLLRSAGGAVDDTTRRPAGP